MTLALLISLVVNAVLFGIVWSYARDNRELTAKLDQADNNDGRDPKTGRYRGADA